MEKSIAQEADLEFRMAYPVRIIDREPDDQHPEGIQERRYTAFPFKLLKDLKQAVASYGPDSPFVIGMVKNMADMDYWIPSDWKVLTKVCFSPSESLQFQMLWNEIAQARARKNIEEGINIGVHQLLGDENYITIEAQLNFDEQTFAQVKEVCLKAWEKLIPSGTRRPSYTTVKQRNDEPYVDFISRLQDAVHKSVADKGAADNLILTLAFENSNTSCQAAIRPFKEQSMLLDYIRLCRDVGTDGRQKRIIFIRSGRS